MPNFPTIPSFSSFRDYCHLAIVIYWAQLHSFNHVSPLLHCSTPFDGFSACAACTYFCFGQADTVILLIFTLH